MEKTLYKILLFLLLSLALVDLAMMIMVTVFSANYPQLQPFQLIIGLSFLVVTGFLIAAWKKYKEQFGSSGKK